MRFNWVDCKEKLPTEVKQYLVRTTDNTLEIDLRTPCEKKDISYAFRMYSVKQWCELPKPYYPYCSEEFLAENPWCYGVPRTLIEYCKAHGSGYYLTSDRYGYIKVVHIQEKDWQINGGTLWEYAISLTAIMFIEGRRG